MSQTVLLVDYENVRNVDLVRIPAHVQVHLFVGASQKNTTFDFSEQMRALGARFTLTRITGNGKNALDFHIAYYLAEYVAKSPKAAYIVLSRDKGFDPLIQHLIARSVDVRRAAAQQDAYPVKTPAAAAEVTAKHVMDLLRKGEKSKRPRKRAGLLAHLKTHYSKKLSAAEVEGLVQEMFERKLLSEVSNRLNYHF